MVTLEEVQDRMRPVRRWLWWVAAFLIAIVLVGGLTRLTGSGLSITEWRPITGVLPPLSEIEWQAEFERYRAIPQFLAVNTDMMLADFKFIYWWEWTHRLLARAGGRRSCCRSCSSCGAGSSIAYWAGNSPEFSRSAGCRARSAGGWCSRASRSGPTSASTGSRCISRSPARSLQRPSWSRRACSLGARHRPCRGNAAWREFCCCSCSCRFFSARWWPRPGRGSRSIPGR